MHTDNSQLTDQITPAEGLERELARLLNRHSAENVSNTPDFILARVLIDALDAFNRSVRWRARWYDGIREPGRGDEANNTTYDSAVQRDLVRRLSDQRDALNAAYTVIMMIPQADPRVDADPPTSQGQALYDELVNAASRWVTRYKPLTEPPMEITVEDDEDPEGAGVESEYQVTERDAPGGS
jgi:hypothetical protein